jgi:high-affinity Fe2+/Pb2+ permease
MNKKVTFAGTAIGVILAGMLGMMFPSAPPNLDNIERLFQFIRDFFPLIVCGGLAGWVYTLHEEHKSCRESLVNVHKEINGIYSRIYKIEKDNASQD